MKEMSWVSIEYIMKRHNAYDLLTVYKNGYFDGGGKAEDLQVLYFLLQCLREMGLADVPPDRNWRE